jgi:hypothetical protein
LLDTLDATIRLEVLEDKQDMHGHYPALRVQ